ncbi:F-box/LRR-repeat protein 14 [Trebouxia sp. C0009 RCD-2024]
MNTRWPGACSIKTNNKLVALYKHPDVRALLDALAAETMSAFFGGLTRLGNTYKGLTELDLSQGVAVMSCKDFANMWRDGYRVHPQGHAALTQQALPISIKALLRHLLPVKGGKLLPGLTLLHLRFVKVAPESIKLTFSSFGTFSAYLVSRGLRLAASFFYPGDLWTGAPLLLIDTHDMRYICRERRLAYLNLRQFDWADAAADTFDPLYHLKGFTLDDPYTKLTVRISDSIFWLMGLQQLTLTHTSLPEAELSELRHLDQLTSLNLRATAKLACATVRVIASLSKLKALDLSSCPLLSRFTLEDLSRLTSLEQLMLRRCSLSDKRLTVLEVLSKLTLLDLTKCSAKPWVQIPQLCALNLACCQLGTVCMEALATMTALQSLNLDFACGLYDDHIFALSALVELTSLSMQLCGSDTSPIGCWTLAALQHMPKLADLNLSSGHLTPLALLPLGYLTYLTRLELAECKTLCTADMLVVSSLHRLRQLNLTSCHALRDASMQRVLPSTLQQLTALTISRNDALTDAIMPTLCGLTSLRFLDVSDCALVSEAAVDELYTALPRLQKVVSNGVEKEVVPIRAINGCKLM